MYRFKENKFYKSSLSRHPVYVYQIDNKNKTYSGFLLTHIPTFIKLKANVNNFDESLSFISTKKINRSLNDLKFNSDYFNYRFLKKDKILIKNLIRINDRIDDIEIKYRALRNLIK